MKELLKQGVDKVEVKGSLFVAYAFNVKSVEEANTNIATIVENNKSAKHVVYAYVIGKQEKYTEDGEPAGTAGKAIYSLLKKGEYTNILVVVVRYFGGVLLGTGLLTRTYQQVAKQSLLSGGVTEHIEYEIKEYTIEYAQEGKVLNEIVQKNGIILSKEYTTCVNITAKIPKK